MFLSTVHHHHHMPVYTNPFSMGCMAMNPRINFFLGMAAATAVPMACPMPMYYGNPFLGSVFMAPSFGFYNFGMMTNPFVNNFVPSYNFPSFNLPLVNSFSYTPNTSGFGSITSNYAYLNQNNKIQKPESTNSSNSSNNSQNDLPKITYNSASKLKPGLLKGNLVGKEAVITELCEKYDVDLGLVVSIIGQESGFGTSNLAQHNNFMGYRAAGDCGKSSKGFGYFSTPEKGLEVAIRNLSKYPERYSSVKKADMNNIDAIGKIYCEGDTYASAIKNLYNTTVRGYLA